MHYYKATIQYDGTNYAGFQWQKGLPSVQSAFNNALKELLCEKFTTMSASRTDTGVHAAEQIVKISSIETIDCSSFVELFNKLLPSNINCLKIDTCEGSFKPAAEAISKEYRYFFTNKSRVLKDETQFVANISNKLNIDLMKSCIETLIGEHNFCNFYSSGSNVKSTIRNILTCELTEINPHDIFPKSDLFHMPTDLTQCYQVKIEANGFLKQMIRHLVSALWMVGSEKVSSQEFTTLLNGPKTFNKRWKVASPNGLFLYKIHYK